MTDIWRYRSVSKEANYILNHPIRDDLAPASPSLGAAAVTDLIDIAAEVVSDRVTDNRSDASGLSHSGVRQKFGMCPVFVKAFFTVNYHNQLEN